MRNAWYLVLLLGAALLPAAGDAPGEAGEVPRCLYSWGFEEGLQGWTKWSNGEMVQAVREGNANTGRRALYGRTSSSCAMVHLVEGLNVPMVGAKLRFCYYVSPESTFDRFTVGVRTHEHGPQPTPPFQVCIGLRKGRWTLAEVPFSHLLGWSERAFHTAHARMMEISVQGKGEMWLDDVQIATEDGDGSAPTPAPSILWLAGQSLASAAPGARAFFRRRFELAEVPSLAWVQAGGDDEAAVYVNGVELGKAGWGIEEFDVAALLRRGVNVLALSVLNHGSAPNPSGAVAVLGWGDRRPDEHLLVTDGAWRCSPEPVEGWATAEFDDARWTPPSVCPATPAPLPVPEIFPLRPPVDRRLPEVRIEVDARTGKVLAAVTPRRPLAAALPFTARLYRLDAQMDATEVRSLESAVPPGASESRFEFPPLDGVQGACEAEITFSGGGNAVRQAFWAGGVRRRLDRRTSYRGKATGFFHVEQIGGRWWLVDGEGNLFFSSACNAVMHRPDWSRHYSRHVSERYLDAPGWEEVTAQRLFDWGFNSSTGSDEGVEPYASRNMPYFAGWNLLWAGPWLQGPEGERIQFPDVFDPEWRKGAEARVKETTDRFRDDPLLVGYFTDNEIWMHDPLSSAMGLMGKFWSPGCRQELTRWLRARYRGDVARLNRTWSSRYHRYAYPSFEALADDKPAIRGKGDPVAPDLTAFVRHLVRTYAQVYVSLWKKHDPNHLVFTNRFAGQFDTSFADLLRPYDVIACNSYPRAFYGQTRFDAGQMAWIREMHRASGRPVLISEWGTMARDSGLTNGWGRLDTQQERADAYENVLNQLWDERYVVGAHWFCWGDSTDGERANWGIVDAFDRPYRPLAAAMVRAHRLLTERVRAWRPVGRVVGVGTREPSLRSQTR